MKIAQCSDIYSVDTISMEDLIYGKAMLNRTSTVGTVVSINAIFNSVPITQPLELQDFNSNFQGAENIKTTGDLVNFLAKLKEDFIYPLDRLDDFLTFYVNQYLTIVMKLSYTIDSAFVDLEELFQIEEVRKSPGLDKMLTFFSRLFYINFKNRETLKEILEKEKEEDTEFNRIIYPIPVLVINPVCGLIGFGKENSNGMSMSSLKSFLDSNEISKTVCQDNSFYPVLEEIRQASKEFDELGYITIYHRTLDDMKYGLISNKVFHRADGTYYLTK